MNYIMIRTDDMLNGDGLRVVLFCTACDHHCKECHNPETWDKNNGMLFDETSKSLIFKELNKDYISGITLSGGDPLHENNVYELLSLVKEIKHNFPNKTIWIYSGYTFEEIFYYSNYSTLESDHTLISYDNYDCIELANARKELIKLCDVFVDGKFSKELADVNYHWAGSTNQRVIDIKKTIKNDGIVLIHKDNVWQNYH